MQGTLYIATEKQLNDFITSAVTNSVSSILKKLEKPEKKEWLTRREKADKENISVSMVDKLVRAGTFTKKKIGRKTLIKA